MTILLVFSLTINLAAVGTLFYFWQRPPFPELPPPGQPFDDMNPRPGPGMGPGPAWRDSSLPAEKRQTIRQLRRQFHEQVQPKRIELQRAQDEVMKIMSTHPSQRDSIDRASQKVLAIQAEIEKMTIDHLLSIRALLDDDQWKSLMRLIERERREIWRAPFAPRQNRSPFKDEKQN